MSFEHSTAMMDGVVYSAAPQTAKTEKETKTAFERALAKKIIGYELTDEEKTLIERAEATELLYGKKPGMEATYEIKAQKQKKSTRSDTKRGF